jgi:5-methylcytosine-specific restriction endonuclease McrA
MKTIACQSCGKTFQVSAYRSETAKYCSKPCWSHRNPSQPRQCIQCGQTFNSRDKTARYCSRSCAGKYRSQVYVAEKSPNWKGGSSLLSKRAQVKGELAKWRQSVYVRDRFTCQRCGAHGVALHAHHPKPVAEYPELMTAVDNGLSLCIPCHELEHGRKLVSPSAYPKHCALCGAATTGRSLYCRSCSVSEYHRIAGHKPTRYCAECGSPFIGRNGQSYCSVSCGVKATHARSKSLGVNPI